MDGAINKLPEFSGMGANLLTQLFAGLKNKDTTVWVAGSAIAEAWRTNDVKGIARGVQQVASRLVVIEAPVQETELRPVA